MKTVEKSIVVRVPVDIAYATWQNIQNFPSYTPHILSVKRLSKTRSRWVIDILGYHIQFEAELDEVRPNRLISWHTVSDVKNLGLVNFRPAPGGTLITVRISFDVKGLSTDLIEDLNVDWNEFEVGFEDALENFKAYVEQMWWQMPAVI